MTIRPAKKEDIPFIIDAILEIEKTSSSDTFTNLFGCSSEKTMEYLQDFFLDEENLDTEFSLGTYIIAEENGERAGCCSLIFTGENYSAARSDLFPIFLQKEHLLHLAEKAGQLPQNNETPQNVFFIEYIFVHPDFRGKNIASEMIDYQCKNINNSKYVYLNVLTTNIAATAAYKKMGFEVYKVIKIDADEPRIYPSNQKNIMRKKIS